jgi:hypothetical protein
MLRQVQAQRVCLGEEIARMLFAEMWVLAGGSLAVPVLRYVHVHEIEACPTTLV